MSQAAGKKQKRESGWRQPGGGGGLSGEEKQLILE